MKNILNIGVLAHVDAGKTTLTEQILFKTGVINRAGSVDQGNTTTDSLDIERRRGITVKSAAVSFMLGELKVNLIDTPGHADFISEVEHSLSVLDGVILVISAVEGVQAQTRVLMQTLKEQGIPTILFINKLDRMGADYRKVCSMIRQRLSGNVCEMSVPSEEGTAWATVRPADPHEAGWLEILASNNEDMLRHYAHDIPVSTVRLQAELRQQTKNAAAYPLFAGSAARGVGIDPLLEALQSFLPVHTPVEDSADPISGLAFKVMKQANGERLVYLRLFAGSIRKRERIPVVSKDGHTTYMKVKQLFCLMHGAIVPTDGVYAGDIAVLGGVDVKVGDVIGVVSDRMKSFRFERPPIQVKVSAMDSKDAPILHLALSDLTMEDPFLQYARDSRTQESFIHVFGKVQQEILLEIIREQYGIEAVFSAPKVICLEKPVSIGAAVERMGEPQNPFYATVGFRVEPGIDGSGLQYRLEVELGSLPLSFQKAIKDTVFEVLQEGLFGWSVTDIVVTLTHTGYASPVSTAKDFRSLTPLVLMKALNEAGTNVYEPVNKLQFIVPEFSLSKVSSSLAALEGTFEEPRFVNGIVHINGTIPVRTSDQLKAEVHALTSGEGLLTIRPGGHVRVRGNIPENSRKQVNPLHRGEYMLYLNNIM